MSSAQCQAAGGVWGRDLRYTDSGYSLRVIGSRCDRPNKPASARSGGATRPVEEPFRNSCHRREIAAERHVRADEDAIATDEGQSHGLIMRVPQSDREPASLDLGFEVQHSEHSHAIRRDSVLVVHDADVTEAEGLDQGLNDFVVGNGPMGFSGRGSWHEGKRFARNRPALISDECAAF